MGLLATNFKGQFLHSFDTDKTSVISLAGVVCII